MALIDAQFNANIGKYVSDDREPSQGYQTPTEGDIRSSIHLTMDPYLGGRYRGEDELNYFGSEIERMINEMGSIYVNLNIDYQSAALNGLPNPLTIQQVPDSCLFCVNYLIERQNNLPYKYFLIDMKLDYISEQSLTNFEPNYLGLLMASHPNDVQNAESKFYLQLNSGDVNWWEEFANKYYITFE